jgi:hypothetical protein
MGTVAPSGGGVHAAVANNNAGTIIKGGTPASDSPIQNSFTEADWADNQGQAFGSKVIAKEGSAISGDEFTDRVGISGVVAGTAIGGVTELGYKADGTEWVVQGGNVTRTLAGNAYTGLIGGAAGPDNRRGSTAAVSGTVLLGTVGVDVLAPPASGYNSFVTKSGNTGVSTVFVRPSGAGDEAALDSAANTTRAIPGELTYMFGGKLAQSDDYKAQDTFES